VLSPLAVDLQTNRCAKVGQKFVPMSSEKRLKTISAHLTQKKVCLLEKPRTNFMIQCHVYFILFENNSVKT